MKICCLNIWQYCYTNANRLLLLSYPLLTFVGLRSFNKTKSSLKYATHSVLFIRYVPRSLIRSWTKTLSCEMCRIVGKFTEAFFPIFSLSCCVFTFFFSPHYSSFLPLLSALYTILFSIGTSFFLANIFFVTFLERFPNKRNYNVNGSYSYMENWYVRGNEKKKKFTSMLKFSNMAYVICQIIG